LGDICRQEKKYTESIRNHELANQAHFEGSGQPYEQWACTSMGKSYLFLGDFNNARKFFGIGLKIATSTESNDLVAQSYLNLAICEYREGSLDKAILNCNKAYEICQKIPQLDIKAAVVRNLATLYKKKKQYEKAFSFLELHKSLDDSLKNTESVKQFAEAEYKSKEDKLLYKIEQDKQTLQLEQERREQDAKRHKIVIAFVSLFLLLSMAFAFFIYRSLRQNKLKNQIIEEKQKEILQSIRYAQRIQRSLLPQEKFIERILSNRK
jgi:tetratricopeptide (TPR) repeat protein